MMDEYNILRKKQKKNGFVATALLISIAIALLVMVGAVLVLSKVNDNDRIAASDDSTIADKDTKNDDNAENKSGLTCEGLVKEIVFNDNLTNIKEAAIAYFTNERLPQSVGDTEKITLKSMIDKKLVRTVYDASANQCSSDKSYVEVTKEDDEYVMKIFLSCSDIEDYVIVHLGCYDYCDKDVCEKKEEKTYEYEYKKTTSCTMSPWSDWGNWKLIREKTSNLKKEDIKTETSSKETSSTIDATVNVTYNCNNYPGYALVGDKCVKETTVTDTKEATPSKYSYNCDRYPGYDIVGDKCVKVITTKDTKDATKNPDTYNCDKYPGYTLDGTKCVKSTTDKKDATLTYNCDSYKGYTLDGKKCVKSTTDKKDATLAYNCDNYKGYTLDGTKCVKSTTDTKDAEEITDTKKEYYTCYKKECTTKTVFKCPAGKGCGNYPETSCENVKKTCNKDVEYVTGYKCADKTYKLEETKDGKHICTKTTTDTKDASSSYNCKKYSGYTLDGTKCVKTTTDTKDASSAYDCNKYSGYTLDGTKCTKTTTDKKDATKNPSTYNCDSYKGYTLDGTKCTKTTTTKDTKDATIVPGGYICPKDYVQNDRTCTKTTTTKDTKNATKVTTYTCPSGYTKNNTKCTKKGTETIKTTYYRYATRTCTGGSTDYKWSESKNDSTLISEGYKLTGKKREIIVK